jgi:hypothetical protein
MSASNEDASSKLSDLPHRVPLFQWDEYGNNNGVGFDEVGFSDFGRDLSFSVEPVWKRTNVKARTGAGRRSTPHLSTDEAIISDYGEYFHTSEPDDDNHDDQKNVGTIRTPNAADSLRRPHEVPSHQDLHRQPLRESYAPKHSPNWKAPEDES